MKMKFNQTWCSQCGTEQGPGDSGVSHCADHEARAIRADPAYNEMKRTGEIDRRRDHRALLDHLSFPSASIEAPTEVLP